MIRKINEKNRQKIIIIMKKILLNIFNVSKENKKNDKVKD